MYALTTTSPSRSAGSVCGVSRWLVLHGSRRAGRRSTGRAGAGRACIGLLAAEQVLRLVEQTAAGFHGLVDHGLRLLDQVARCDTGLVEHGLGLGRQIARGLLGLAHERLGLLDEPAGRLCGLAGQSAGGAGGPAGDVAGGALRFVDDALVLLVFGHRSSSRVGCGPVIVPATVMACKRAGHRPMTTLACTGGRGPHPGRGAPRQPSGSGGAIEGSAGTSSAAVTGRSSSGPRRANQATTAP